MFEKKTNQNNTRSFTSHEILPVESFHSISDTTYLFSIQIPNIQDIN